MTCAAQQNNKIFAAGWGQTSPAGAVRLSAEVSLMPARVRLAAKEVIFSTLLIAAAVTVVAASLSTFVV